MRKIIFPILCLTYFSGSCQIKNARGAEKIKQEHFDCPKGTMPEARYEFGKDEPISVVTKAGNDFMILVDSNLKASNFISFGEQNARELSTDLDTFTLSLLNPGDWHELSVKEKFEKLAEKKISYRRQADSLHIANNQRQNQVWIINNTKDTVSIQMQDESYICVLQALTKKGQWLPVQYWRFSHCGNSYYDKHLPPKTANSFLAKLPDNGEYETMLRFKLLGRDKFYYSNEFTGKINYCDFVEERIVFDDGKSLSEPQYKLENFVKRSLY